MGIDFHTIFMIVVGRILSNLLGVWAVFVLGGPDLNIPDFRFISSASNGFRTAKRGRADRIFQTIIAPDFQT
jgi:hypothetical protein